MWSEMATISARRERRIDPAGGVAHDQGPHADRGDDPHAEPDLGRRVALVAMDPPAEQEDGLAPGMLEARWNFARHQPTRMAGHVVSGKQGSDA